MQSGTERSRDTSSSPDVAADALHVDIRSVGRQRAQLSSDTGGPSERPAAVHCPRCGSSMVRKRRNWLDRLRSMKTAKHRYRCVAFGCGWEGLVLVDPHHSWRR